MTTTGSPRDHLEHLSDGALMRHAADHHVMAFEVFYGRHISSAHALSYRVMGTTQRADDVCQDAFLSIWRAAASYDPALGSARSWVLSIVRNRAIDSLRVARRATDRDVLDDLLVDRLPAATRDGTEAAAMRNLSATATRGLLRLLNSDQQQVIELSFFRGYTHAEIAATLDLPLGTVKARINRGLLKMRDSTTAPEPDGAAEHRPST